MIPKTGRVVVIEINPANLALIGPGIQGHRLSHCAGFVDAGRRTDA